MQTTLARACSVSGRGYWSGLPNTLTFLPAPADTGIQFVRTDLPSKPRVQATADHCVSMPLRTRLCRGACELDMIEHVMSALSGLRIDNVEVHCTAAEMPGLDGSSHAYALALEAAGIETLEKSRPCLRLDKVLHVGDEQCFVRIEPQLELPIGQAGFEMPRSESLDLEYQLDFGPGSPIPAGAFRWQLDPRNYLSKIAPARTFISWADAEVLRKQGMAAHVTDRDLLVFGDQGPINNQLRFSDECVRHKLLDLIGDLALAGIDLVGRVIARRSGHQLNGEMAARLRSLFLEGVNIEESCAA